MRRSVAALPMALALWPAVLGGTTSAGAASAGLVLVLERTTAGASSFDLSVQTHHRHEATFIGMVGARVENGRIMRMWPGTTNSQGRHQGPSVQVNDTTVGTCDAGALCACDGTDASPGICVGGLGGSVLTARYTDDGDGPDRINAVFVAAAGEGAGYAFQGEGWSVREVDWEFSLVHSSESDSIRVTSGGSSGADLFLEARAPGGPQGSIALATPPCAETGTAGIPGAATADLARGVGRAVLSGGVQDRTVICPVHPPQSVASWATGATEWRFAGVVAGDATSREARLLVLNLPEAL